MSTDSDDPPAICGNAAPISGSISHRDERTGGLGAEVTVHRGVSHVPAGRQGFVDSPVAETVRLGASGRHEAWEERRQQVYALTPGSRNGSIRTPGRARAANSRS